MFKNMVLRKIFGSKRNEVAGEWRSFLVCIAHQLKKNVAGAVARMGSREVHTRVLVWKTEGKRPLGRPRRKRDNIKMDL